MAVWLSAFLLGSSLPLFAQSMSKQDYLDKSRRQKTTGFIMLGGGVAMVTAGSILFSENFILFGASNADDNAAAIGAAMVVVGGLATIGSIPLFISAGNNKRKSSELSFKNLPSNIPKYSGNIPRSIPSVTYSIPLN
ncbi:hypothetical protein BC751_1445 [Cecembia calidifontis]|uniref:Uncharacterized protein n=2 Tax=Cecembia calidifontis TaxID=1187080 RepID=A0A4Q7P707_9BACT|nr:hypothetical protein BC751_1445 [Cecembia calidifontis]